MSALLPCPFCGARGILLNSRWEDGQHSIDCMKCGAMGPATLDKAVAGIAWNRRAEPPELANLRAENARLREALGCLGFGTDLDAHLNLTGALIDMEHTPTAPPDRVCWATLNRVVAQLQATRAALAPQEALTVEEQRTMRRAPCQGVNDQGARP